MKLQKLLFAVSVASLLVSSTAAAAGDDFAWIKDFNIRAEADPSGFRAQIAARFKIGDAEITALLSNVESPADAYMVCRFGELSECPRSQVLERYESLRGKGWGVIAKSMGIKPGSKEFHALKRGHDLYDDKGKAKDRKIDEPKAKKKRS